MRSPDRTGQPGPMHVAQKDAAVWGNDMHENKTLVAPHESSQT